MKYLFSLLISFLVFNVLAQGPKPSIVGQDALSINEEQSITIRLTHLRVYDRDSFFYPWGFTLTVYDGEDYTVSGYTITPATNFNGILSVSVSVNDGRHESDKYNLKITVLPVNDPPVIINQSPLTTIEDTPLQLTLANLTVQDPDDSYPNGFNLIVQSGTNYTVNATTITPSRSFVGTLSIPVMVNDGDVNSTPYTLTVVVQPGNKRPVISGQTTLSMPRNTAITIALSHLKVTDPDNVYPDDFKLIIYAGNNYSFSGNTITPAPNYTGPLVVNIAVNDGNKTSETYALLITVNDELQITGQEPVTIDEDTSFKITPSHLQVYDPKNEYPANYTIQIKEGENYTVKGNEIIPAHNFFGELKVNVAVTNGEFTSRTFDFQITLSPVNDAPELINFPGDALRYNIENGPVNIITNSIISDVDDTELIMAEVGILDLYEPEYDELTIQQNSSIQAVFDEEQGILSLVGKAPLSEYAAVLNTIQFNYNSIEGSLPPSKTISIKISDGKDESVSYERKIMLLENIDIDIPNVFTPNDDLANDTWKVRLLKSSDRYNNAIIRVFTKRGVLVYESVGFEQPWNGKYNGDYLPADTYFYTIDFKLNAIDKNLKGAVTILR